MDAQIVRALTAAARKAVSLAYCPYTKFPVGAAVLAHSGVIYLGANVENMLLTPTKHAEEVAFANAFGNGELANALKLGLDKTKFITALAVYAPKEPGTWPCPVCRATLSEFFHNQPIIAITGPGEMDFQIKRFSELLPHGMNPDDVLKARESE